MMPNRFGSGPSFRRFAAGETFDVALVWPAQIDRLLEEGKLAAGTRAEVARVAIAVAVRKGTPNPDINTTEAFKRALLAAKSVSHSAEGASGVHLKSVFERLGITAEMQPKLRPAPGGPYVGGPVVRGEVELAIITTPYIVIEPVAGAAQEEVTPCVQQMDICLELCGNMTLNGCAWCAQLP